MIKEEHEEHHYSIRSLCKLGNVTRAAYYKWLNRIETANDRLNKQISDQLEAIHQEHPAHMQKTADKIKLEISL